MAIFARDNTDTMNNIRVCLASDPELREEFTKMGEAEKADEMKKKIAELRALSREDKTE